MTPAELRIAALQEAEILASGENPSAADVQTVAQKHEALHDLLIEENLVSWVISEDVPKFAEAPMTMMLAAMIGPSFGITAQKLADLRMGYAAGESMMRKLMAKKYVSQTAQTEYF